MFLSENQKKKKIKFESYINNNFRQIKVEIPAGNAAITPPLGPLLGQYGMNTMEFCKEFNEETKLIEKDTILPIIIYLTQDKQYYFELNTPGVAYLFRKNLESLELEKNNYFFSKIEFLKICYNILLLKKLLYNNTNNITLSSNYFKNYINSIIGTAKSFGIKINK
jgi:large subunit ribosomal protein L11